MPRAAAKYDRKKTPGQLNAVGSELQGMVTTLANQLNQLNSELKADEEGITSYQNIITVHKLRREELVKRTKAAEATFEEDALGSVMDSYDDFVTDLKNRYKTAADFHAAGIQLLKDHFSYHPEFLHAGDYFHAKPFTPKA